jgi:hypothetical protein
VYKTKEKEKEEKTPAGLENFMEEPKKWK